MDKATALEQLAEIAGWAKADPEAAHEKADEVLLHFIDPDVADAYAEVVEAAPWWVTA